MIEQHEQCDTLYYDGSCPLCRREIAVLKKAAGPRLALVDVHAEDLLPHGLTQTEMLRSLHLKKSSGEIVKGLDANITAWELTMLAPIVRILRWPVVSRIAEHMYNAWAERRFNKHYRHSKSRTLADAETP